MLEGMLQQVRPEVLNNHLSCLETPHPSNTISQEVQFSSFSASTEGLEEADELSSKGGRAQMSGNNDTTQTLPCQMPSPAIGSKLSKAYFEHVHTQYPFLHEATFRNWEERIMGNLDDTSVDPVVRFFVNIGFYASAQLYMDHVIQLDSIESIQAILCCAMYSLRSPVGVSVSLSGLALRQCIELGYHRSARKFSLSLDPLRLEMRKRVFWCSYGIDRAASMTLGRPFGIPDQEIDIEYPMDIDESLVAETGVCREARTCPAEPPTTMSAAIHTFRLRRIWSQIHISLYSSSDVKGHHDSTTAAKIESLFNELTDWRDTTPPQRLTDTTLSVFDSYIWFNLAYNHSILLLYRGQLTRHYTLSDPKPVDTFIQCSRAAQEICLEYRRIYIKQPVSYTWGALNILFLADLTYLHCLWTSPEIHDTTRQDEISSTCTACTMVLVVLAERWEQAAPYRDIFEALASKTMSMIVDKHRELWMIAEAPVIVQQGPNLSLSNETAQWVTDIADVGMSDGIESLLTGLVYDFRTEDFGQGQTDF
ncbi:related to purine utilization positive regulator [Phialocephala subalpina]|uniref:Related to purine utilization positive regulator n=1 Tax=Phialocephala subalpina TaxID=576137 RepID=A0A1L7XUE5_9HELO|nr:related to purine utilization positive regulator [Phialocephala subalpina]